MTEAAGRQLGCEPTCLKVHYSLPSMRTEKIFELLSNILKIGQTRKRPKYCSKSGSVYFQDDVL